MRHLSFVVLMMLSACGETTSYVSLRKIYILVNKMLQKTNFLCDCVLQ